MLDENLPAFFWKRSPDNIDHHEALYLSYQGSDPALAYTLKHGDPKDSTSRNCYAAALFDSYNPDVLYGEVLVQPTWSKPTLSQEEIRKNGGLPPPPQASIPGEFTIQLYEPDQQVVVRRKTGLLSSSTSYDFDMPQTSFRTPSVSALDRTRDDPAATLTTPKINFVWRKESRLSKDYTCFLTGKSTDTVDKKRKKDPDIAIALFRSLREITIYEPNLSRVEIEDLKGLEVVILLAAATIKDIYLSDNPRQIFNIDDVPTRKLSSGGRKVVPTPSQVPTQPAKSAQKQFIPTTVNPNAAQGARPGQVPGKGQPLPNKSQIPPQAQQKPSKAPTPPVKDAREQWQIDAETARLRAQVAAEEKEAAKQAASRKKEKEKADEAETKRLKKMVEQEQKEAKKKQKQVDEETEKLRKRYGNNLPQLPVRPGGKASGSNSGAKVKPQSRPQQQQRPHSGMGFLQPIPQGAPMRPNSAGHGPPPPHAGGRMYMHPNKSAYATTSTMMSGGNPGAGPSHGPKPKKSFLGLKDLEEEFKRVSKKRSSIW